MLCWLATLKYYSLELERTQSLVSRVFDPVELQGYSIVLSLAFLLPAFGLCQHCVSVVPMIIPNAFTVFAVEEDILTSTLE